MGHGKTAEKQPEKTPETPEKHPKTVKTAVFRVFRVFFRLFFGWLTVTHSAPFSAVLRLFSMSGIWHLCRWPRRLQHKRSCRKSCFLVSARHLIAIADFWFPNRCPIALRGSNQTFIIIGTLGCANLCSTDYPRQKTPDCAIRVSAITIAITIATSIARSGALSKRLLQHFHTGGPNDLKHSPLTTLGQCGGFEISFSIAMIVDGPRHAPCIYCQEPFPRYPVLCPATPSLLAIFTWVGGLMGALF